MKTFTYDSAGNVSTMTVTRNGTVDMSQSYEYDKLNRLVSVSENGVVIATYSYDAKGNRTQTVAPGGETTNYNYNIANKLISQTTGDKLSEQYTYYLNGNQKTKTSNGTTTTYEYDKMNRLVSENDTDYTFDDFGNRISMSDGNVITTYSYDLNNRLLESAEENGDVTTSTKFFYDDNGNQITKAIMINQPYTEGMSGDYTISDSTNNYITLYEYNCYNQLVGVDTNGIVSSYAYAPDGLRHSKTVDGNTTIFVYGNANVIEEITANDTNKYYRGFEIIKNNDGLYYLYNGQGDVAFLVNTNGTTVADYVFDAYGNQSEDNTIYNPFGYRGEYQDEESGLVYLRARMYDPTTGRFINEDPIKDGLNWYEYCGNNPLMYIDPWGTYYIKKNTDGTFDVVKHNFFTSLIASVCSVYIPSSIQSNVEKEWFNYVGGNSVTKGDFVSDVSDFAVEKIIVNIGTYGKKIFKIINVGEAISKTYSGHKILDNDNISFGLLSRAGVSLTSNDKEKLESIMSKTYGFIDNNSYFTEGMGEIFRGASAHQIDYEVSQSSNPQKVIDSYTNRAYSFYCSYGFKTEVAKGMSNSVRSYLEGYSQRREEIFDIFKSYITAE